MNLACWLEANSIFERLIELPASEREAELETQCGSDPALRAVVENLLAADAAATARHFLEAAPPVTATLAEDAKPPERAATAQQPERLDKFRLLGEIGRGGMGTIYAAVRDDDTIEQKVAIKVIRAGFESEDIIRRMRLERRILARLQHPNIARIYDAGRTEQGLPYFVMELVEGLPIDAYCRQQELGLRERLELIRRVCVAVEYANENLIVHRDIKPSNILITRDGEPKLLDFGIAKILEPDTQNEPNIASRTEPWRQRVTLEYSSPEHIRGQPLSISCDVYSLGALLYKLLTGDVPRPKEDVTLWLYDRGSRTADLQRPSLRVAAGKENRDRPAIPAMQLSRALAGDLDSIVLAALDENVESRYPSAKALGDDLERYLEGFPVSARHGNASYRFGKFLRRHVRAALVATLVLSLTGALLTSIIHSGLQAAEGRKRLQAEGAKREHVLDIFLGIFEQAGPLVSQGVPLSLQQAVDHYVERGDLTFPNQPDVEAAVASTLGWINLELGDWQKARHHHTQALSLRRGLHPDTPEAVESMIGVAAALRGLGQLDEARVLSAQALGLATELEDLDSHLHLRVLNRHVEILCSQGDWPAADPVSRDAFLLSRTLIGSKSAEVPIASSQRALTLRKLGDAERAEALYRDTLRTLERDHGPHHPLAALVHNNLASIAYRQQRWELAIKDWTRADQLFAQTYGEDYYQRAVASSNLGRALAAAGRVGEAETALRQAMRVALDSPSLGPRYEHRYFGVPAVELADLLLESGRCVEVLDLLANRVEVWKDHKVTRQAKDRVRRCRDQLARQSQGR